MTGMETRLTGRLTEMDARLTGMDARLTETKKEVARLSSNFGFFHEILARVEASGLIPESTKQLKLGKPSDLLYYCSGFNGFDRETVMKRVRDHIDTKLAPFLDAFFSATPLSATVLGGNDFKILANGTARGKEKKEYLVEGMKHLQALLKDVEGRLAAIETSNDLRKEAKKLKHAISTLDCIREYYLKPVDLDGRLDSSLGLMVLTWESNPAKIVKSLELDMRGQLRIEKLTTEKSDASDAGPSDAGPSDAGPLDAGASDAGASDTGAAVAGPSDIGASDAGASDAKKITVFMGEIKTAARNIVKVKQQLALRLLVLRHFLLVSGLATANKDQFFLQGRIYYSSGQRSKAEKEEVMDSPQDTRLTVLLYRRR